MIDSLLITTKSIFVNKNKIPIVVFIIIISQMLLYTIISKVIMTQDITMIIVISISAGVGSGLAMLLNNKFSKDKTYINVITAKSKEDMDNLCLYLQNNKIKNIILDTVNKDYEHTLAVMIFCETKSESKLLNDYINNNNTKFFIKVWN